MQLNADLDMPASAHGADLVFVSSGTAGVDRKMLDRVGDEVARATSLVRYAPGASFHEHAHEKGEEFFVLEGVFSDATGDYPAWTYVRNAPGSRHAPWSHPTTPTLIWVKLRQMPASERNAPQVVRRIADDVERLCSRVISPSKPAETAERGFVYQQHEQQGRIDLYHSQATGETVRIEVHAPHSKIRQGGHRMHDNGEEYLVLRGSFLFRDEEWEPQSWMRLPHGYIVAQTEPFIAGDQGVVLLVKQGHLALEV